MNIPPKDLAGYQNIVTGHVEAGDIVVAHNTRWKMWAPDSWIGYSIENVAAYDVYRKMDVPRHEGETKHVFNPADWTHIPDGDLQKAKTDDSGKPPLATLPWKALRKVSQVQAYGHKKYGDFYNYKKGMEATRQLGCAIRHIADYMDGIDLDKESGQSHLAHAACRILFALENESDGKLVDDRFKPKKK